jgi:hypothetical protein
MAQHRAGWRAFEVVERQYPEVPLPGMPLPVVLLDPPPDPPWFIMPRPLLLFGVPPEVELEHPTRLTATSELRQTTRNAVRVRFCIGSSVRCWVLVPAVGNELLWTVAPAPIVLPLLGLLTGTVLGGLVRSLPIIAMIVIVLRILEGRR